MERTIWGQGLGALEAPVPGGTAHRAAEAEGAEELELEETEVRVPNGMQHMGRAAVVVEAVPLITAARAASTAAVEAARITGTAVPHNLAVQASSS